MIKLQNILEESTDKQKKPRTGKKKVRYKKLVSMGRISTGIINELYSPIDSINRFINLALQNIGEDSQTRQFLLDSKQGVRKTSHLLKRLDDYAKKIEKEFLEISERDGEKKNINSE